MVTELLAKNYTIVSKCNYSLNQTNSYGIYDSLIHYETVCCFNLIHREAINSK